MTTPRVDISEGVEGVAVGGGAVDVDPAVREPGREGAGHQVAPAAGLGVLGAGDLDAAESCGDQLVGTSALVAPDCSALPPHSRRPSSRSAADHQRGGACSSALAAADLSVLVADVRLGLTGHTRGPGSGRVKVLAHVLPPRVDGRKQIVI